MLRVAGRPGPSFPLDPSTDNVLGRSPAALVVLADRLASRAHAAVSFDAAQGRWTLRDLESRNGTWLDGVQIATAALDEGAVIRVGTSEFLFRLQADPADVVDAGGRIMRRGPPGRFEAAALRRAGTDDARWPMLLYQASMRLLAATSPHEIVATTLELIVEFTAATTCGWFHIGGQADLEPVCVVPPGSNLMLRLDEAGADAVACAGEATWCRPAPDTRTGADTDFDVACVPLLDDGQPHAVLAISAAGGMMRDADFEILVALASLAAAAWAGHAGRPTDGPLDGSPGGTAGSRTADSGSGSASDVASGAAMSASDGGTLPLTAEDLRDAIAARREPTAVEARIGNFVAETSTLRLEDWQKALVVEALRRTGGSVPNAAAELGISRATLYRKLEAYGLTRR
jgi:DNA-binding protein Fis